MAKKICYILTKKHFGRTMYATKWNKWYESYMDGDKLVLTKEIKDFDPLCKQEIILECSEIRSYCELN